MIMINKLKINNNGVIEVNVQTSPGHTFNKVLAWSTDTFQNESRAIDITYLLSRTSNSEVFNIYPSDLQVPGISGLFMIKFFTTEVDELNNSITGIVANLAQMNNCLLNKVLELDIQGCSEVSNSECQSCSENLYYLQALIQALTISIKEGYITESVKIAKNIDEFCDICDTCPNYYDTLNINNFTIGIENNIIQ